MLSNFKKSVLEKCFLVIEQEILSATQEINSTKESLLEDTKSSAGDKHETSRAMTHLEIEKSEFALNNLKRTKSELKKINPSIQHTKILLGSIFQTNQSWFFVSASIGKIKVDEKDIITISTLSPIFLALKESKKGDAKLFNGKLIEIIEVF
jgi:HD superfamily phosphohydrolase